MSLKYKLEKETAFLAVKEAAKLCSNVQKIITSEVLQKKDRSPVTIADFGSQSLVCRKLLEVFPNDPIIAEEDSTSLKQPENQSLFSRVFDNVRQFQSHANEQLVCDWIDHGNSTEYSNRFWTLDPIDGTKGFLRGEQYAISLALIVDGEIEIAAVACPNLSTLKNQSGNSGVIFLAERNSGAFEYELNKSDEKLTIQVSKETNSRNAKFCESVESGHSSHSDSAAIANLLTMNKDSVRIDSQAKYGVVARGEAEIYLRLPTKKDYREKIWDHAGGWLIVTEAGGKVTDIHGQPFDFTFGIKLEKNKGVVVTNGHLHEQVLDSIRKLGIR